MTNHRRSEEKEEEAALSEIREIYSFMVEQGLVQLTIEKGNNKLFFRRHEKTEYHPSIVSAAALPLREEKTEEINSAYLAVKSPLIGIFYRAPNPEVKSFVEVGSVVEKEAVLCIVEAMKVMNEIPAPKRGKIIKILVENGQLVQAEQSLFLLQPLEE